ncbi:MAG: HAMP domain-containing protein [Roseiflexaceae bacterium]
MVLRKRLGLRINLVVVGVLGALLLATLLVLNSGVRSLTVATGRQRVEQEVETFRRQITKARHEAVVSAQLLAAVPTLVDSVGKRDLTSMRTAALVNGARYGFKRVRVVDQMGHQLISTAEAPAEEIAQEDSLLSRAGLEIDITAIIAFQEQTQLSLAVSVPIYNLSRQPIGALVARRTFDRAFLDELNFSQESSDLLLIYNGQVVAQSSPNHERLATIKNPVLSILDPASISQAQAGQTLINSDLTSIAGAPYVLAYAPLALQEQASGAIVILVDVSELVTFQNQLITSLAVVFTLLALAAIGLTTLFVHRSVAAPLRGLQSVAEQMARGDYGQPAVVKTQDEIGQLAQAFNTMTTAVQERETALQRLTMSLEQRGAEVEQTLDELRQSVKERDELSQTIRELASPVLPVMRGVLVMPLIGVIDTERVALLTQALLTAVERHRAVSVILDVTGVPLVDTQVARALLHIAETTRLLGAQTILVGLRPELAQTIVGLDLSLTGLITQADLQSGITYAMQRQRGVASIRSW